MHATLAGQVTLVVDGVEGTTGRRREALGWRVAAVKPQRSGVSSS